MKKTLALTFAAALAWGCATEPPKAPPKAEAPKPEPAKCEAPPSELVVRDLVPGTGQTVGFRSAVNVHYTGWLFDGCAKDLKGAQFDSSTGRPVPFGFVVGAGRVIQGWDEGLIGMREKGRRLLVIPPNKGYGAREVGGGKIPANSTLVFEVELLQIIAQPGPPAGK